MHPEMRYKLYKFCENRARDTPLRGVYIPHFGQIGVKISILGSYTLVVSPMGVKFGMEGLHAKFHPHRCNVSPLRGEKPLNRPLSKLSTGRFALRAMLPVPGNKLLSKFGRVRFLIFVLVFMSRDLAVPALFPNFSDIWYVHTGR